LALLDANPADLAAREPLDAAPRDPAPDPATMLIEQPLPQLFLIAAKRGRSGKDL